MNIDQLNEKFGISGSLKFIEGKGKTPLISITNKSAKALISLFGGQVLSYQPVNASQDLLFLSKKAHYDEKKAIRGGIPVCWPWFGTDPEGLNRPNHGFARNSIWSVSHSQTSSDYETKIMLTLIQTPENKSLWPHSFDLTLIVTIGYSLTLELVTSNTGNKIFSITQALHSYINIGNIKCVEVLGLEEKFYFDKLDSSIQKQQFGKVTFVEEVDRIYTGVQNRLSIKDPIYNRSIQITSNGNKTAVVWNPWAKTSAAMTDLEANDYQRFLCLEACNAATDVITVAPGNTHSLLTDFKIVLNE